jgi:hypothetical protein
MKRLSIWSTFLLLLVLGIAVQAQYSPPPSNFVGSGLNSTQVGTGATAGGSGSVVLGASATDGSYGGCVVVGGAGSSCTGYYAVAIGYGATAPDATFVSGAASNPITNVFFGNGVSFSAAGAYTINGSGGSGNNNAGGGLQLAGGKSTGTATPGPITLRSAVPVGSGSTVQTLYDAWSLVGGGAIWSKSGTKALTKSSAISFVQVDVASNSYQGGNVDYCIEATDATDYQSRCGTVSFAMVNKGGTETCTMGTASDISATSTGTITVTWATSTSPTNGCLLQANSVPSITPSTHRINYTVRLTGNSATAVTPQ